MARKYPLDGKADYSTHSTPENPAFAIVDSDGKLVPAEKIEENGVTYYKMRLARKPEPLVAGDER